MVRYGVGTNLTDEAPQIWNTRSFLGIPRASYTDPAPTADGAVELRHYY